MARLPVPGSDDGTWGTLLNDYLTVSHEADGSLKSGISADKIVSGTTNKTFTDAEKTKLANLATVATSGSYADLTNKPVIPGANAALVIAADAPASWKAMTVLLLSLRSMRAQ